MVFFIKIFWILRKTIFIIHDHELGSLLKSWGSLHVKFYNINHKNT